MASRRKKITLRAYDYMTGHSLVVARLKERGETGKMDRHELDRVNVTVEVCAEQAVASTVAEAAMRELADSIIADRNRTLFAAFDERDNMGDETIAPANVERVA